MIYTSVQGGTRAGWKTQHEQRTAWTCSCGEENARYMVNCGVCRKPRSDA